MTRWIAIFGISIIALAGVAAGSGIWGYFSHRDQIAPVYGWAERAIRKVRREIGLPSETAIRVQRVETTFLTLLGTTYTRDDNDFLNGGGLSKWGEDVLMINHHGTIYYLDEDLGLLESDISAPETGKAAYVALAAQKYPDQWPKEDSLRFMDVEFIDSEAYRGLIVSYTFIDVENECYRTRLSGLEIANDVTSIKDVQAGSDDWEIIFETSPCLEFNPSRELIVGYMGGGRVAFKAPNLLYLGSGEYHREGFYREDAGIQDDDSDYGKTIEVDLATRSGRHFSKGHRNLQGVEIDRTGRLWTTEHGMRGGDELNLIVDGENYGWPLENLGTLYNGLPAPTIGEPGRHEVFAAPVFAWSPSAAVSSLARIDGFHETWDGDLLIGSLRGRTLFRARIRGERIVTLEPIPIGERIRDVLQVGPEKLAVMLDSNELVIFTIEERKDPLEGLVAGLVAGGMSQARADTVQDTFVSCNECHSFQELIHGAGPSLHNVADRAIAGTAFSGYSDELQQVGGTWTREALISYLSDPESFAPGTWMTGQGVSGTELAGDIATGFQWLKDQTAP
ncbi:MAG: PQQ-dependent sugar dehydrogenase [Paracoccaceae bacterium]